MIKRCLKSLKKVEGQQQINALMDQLRRNIPDVIAGLKVVAVEDYETLKRIYKEDNTEEAISLPKANVIRILFRRRIYCFETIVQNLNSNSTYHLTSITSNKSHKIYTIIYLVIANSVTKPFICK